MFKSIIKEITIMLLLLITIILVLAILLYDYNPTNKTIPEKVAEYKLDDAVQKELNKSVATKAQDIVKTYTIEEDDLYLYEKNDEYDKGKINPFKLSTPDILTSVNIIAGVNETTGLLNTTTK